MTGVSINADWCFNMCVQSMWVFWPCVWVWVCGLEAIGSTELTGGHRDLGQGAREAKKMCMHTHMHRPCPLISGDICTGPGHWQWALSRAQSITTATASHNPHSISSHPGTVCDVIGLFPLGRWGDSSGAVCFLAVSAMAWSLWAGSKLHIKWMFGAFWQETVWIMQMYVCLCACSDASVSPS